MKPVRTIFVAGCLLILALVVSAGCIGSEEKGVTLPVFPTATVTTGPAIPTATTVPMTAFPPAISTAATSVKTVFVNQSLNGGIITISVGEKVLVRLDENPTTGYAWNATVPKRLAVEYDRYVASNPTLIGAGGYHEWILVPEYVDTFSFKAMYFRTWEGAKPSDKTFSLVIIAQPA
jgi:inhibitor of cysteine peptidase